VEGDGACWRGDSVWGGVREAEKMAIVCILTEWKLREDSGMGTPPPPLAHILALVADNVVRVRWEDRKFCGGEEVTRPPSLHTPSSEGE